MNLLERIYKLENNKYKSEIDRQALTASIRIDIEDTIQYIKDLLDDSYNITQFNREDLKSIIDKLGGDSSGY